MRTKTKAPATDSRIVSAQSLLTARRLMEGHGSGLVRVPAVSRILGVPLMHRGRLLDWVNLHGLWVQPPTSGPLALAPLAGCIDLDRLRDAIERDMARGGLPFTAEHLRGVSSG